MNRDRTESARAAQQAAVAESLRKRCVESDVTQAMLADSLLCSMTHAAHLLARANPTTLTLADVQLLHANGTVAEKQIAVDLLHELATALGLRVTTVIDPNAAAADLMTNLVEVAAVAGAAVRDGHQALSDGRLDAREDAVLADHERQLRELADKVGDARAKASRIVPGTGPVTR